VHEPLHEGGPVQLDGVPGTAHAGLPGTPGPHGPAAARRVLPARAGDPRVPADAVGLQAEDDRQQGAGPGSDGPRSVLHPEHRPQQLQPLAPGHVRQRHGPVPEPADVPCPAAVLPPLVQRRHRHAPCEDRHDAARCHLRDAGGCLEVRREKSLGYGESGTDTLGLALCLCSLVFSSMELIVARWRILGNGFQLNSIDSLLYMAIPVVALLLLPIYIIKHPVAYPGHNAATDFSVAVEVAHLSPGTVVLVMMSGIWALAYNLLLYNIVKGLSPYFASFAANFNKVAAIGLALLLGLETLPEGSLKYLMCVGVVGNMASFTAFSAWPKQPAEEDGEQEVQSL
ncbi:unnamed protein product, partial [Prorocentrum cordatum]